MKDYLSERDERFIQDLLTWDSKKRTVDFFVCNFLLVVAGACIIIAAFYTLNVLTDKTIFGVLVPSFIIGLLFVGLYIILNKRIKERHQVAHIIEQLKRAS
jgi:hypothetical protein